MNEFIVVVNSHCVELSLIRHNCRIGYWHVPIDGVQLQCVQLWNTTVDVLQVVDPYGRVKAVTLGLQPVVLLSVL